MPTVVGHGGVDGKNVLMFGQQALTTKTKGEKKSKKKCEKVKQLAKITSLMSNVSNAGEYKT